MGAANAIWNGDAVEFYLDTRRGGELGAQAFGPGTLHMFWTPFTKTEVKPRMGMRELPAFKDFKLQGAEVAGAKTDWGYTAEFKLPWANFPNFVAKAGEVIGIDCELCSSDGGPRVDRTFVYSSPMAVATPSGIRPSSAGGQAGAASVEATGSSLAPIEPDEIGQLWLALWRRLSVAQHRGVGGQARRQDPRSRRAKW